MQLRRMLKSKIHRARVTAADLQYEGSVTIPPDLMKRADLLEYEAVQIWNITRGTRLETYAILGKQKEIDECAEICINGAAAHLVKPDDLVIIASFIDIAEELAKQHRPKLIFVDNNNHFKEQREELAGPQLASV